MVGHFDWYQYKWIMADVTQAKRKVQQALKPGGGGPGSSNIGNSEIDSIFAQNWSKYLNI